MRTIRLCVCVRVIFWVFRLGQSSRCLCADESSGRLCVDASSGCLCEDDSAWCFVRMIPSVRRNHLGACVGMIRRDVSVRMHLPGASVGVNLNAHARGGPPPCKFVALWV